MAYSPTDYLPDIAIAPGETLKENLEALNLSQKNLADRIGVSEKYISEIIAGKAAINPDISLKLERVFGQHGTAEFWNNLEKDYRETLARLKKEIEIKKEIQLAKKYTCYSELVNGKYVQKNLKMKRKSGKFT